ncbi:hypothetical protein ACSNOI_42755 [Actinomadura kijaniata]|uniref:hypothetical protein n=1 Tax=Actinomadura kijaniata TaxID=46161 RepID=UPI003F1E2CD8
MVPSNQRSTFLGVLDQVIKEDQPELRSGLVFRRGVPILFVACVTNRGAVAEIGCDFDLTHGWTFTWASEERPIGPVTATALAAAEIARRLRLVRPLPRESLA